MKRIGVITATRAEYGLLKNLIALIDEDIDLELCLMVTGTHLSEKYGYTIQEIYEDGFPIAEKIPILANDSSDFGITQTMGTACQEFGKAFRKQQPDMIVVLEDRYELLPICSAAVIMGIPISHISGGEITEGAVDDIVRHCIKCFHKISNLIVSFNIYLCMFSIIIKFLHCCYQLIYWI